MSFFQRRGGRRRPRSRLGTIVNSIKNILPRVDALVASTNLEIVIANAIDDPATSVNNACRRGCLIKAVWVEFWYYGLSAGNTNDIVDIYLAKNPGNNLTMPNPGTVGTSNEKKFVFKTWRGLGGNKSLGGTPYNQTGRWIKIPKRYQRMGIDDRLVLVARSPTTGQLCTNFIYKWYT